MKVLDHGYVTQMSIGTELIEEVMRDAADATSEAIDWLRKKDIEQAFAAIEHARNSLRSAENMLEDLGLNEAPPTGSPPTGSEG